MVSLQDRPELRMLAHELPFPLAVNLPRVFHSLEEKDPDKTIESVIKFIESSAYFLQWAILIAFSNAPIIKRGGAWKIIRNNMLQIEVATIGKAHTICENLLSKLMKCFPLRFQKKHVIQLKEAFPKIRRNRNTERHAIKEIPYDKKVELAKELERSFLELLPALEPLRDLLFLAVVDVEENKRRCEAKLQVLNGCDFKTHAAVNISLAVEANLGVGDVLMADKKLRNIVCASPFYTAEISGNTVKDVWCAIGFDLAKNTIYQRSYETVIEERKSTFLPQDYNYHQGDDIWEVASRSSDGLPWRKISARLEKENDQSLVFLPLSARYKKIKKFIRAKEPSLTDIEYLTAGGMAHIFRATDKKSGEFRIIKLLKENVAAIRIAAEKLREEYTILEDLSSKNLSGKYFPRVFSLIPQDNKKEIGPFYVMEYLPGSTLGQLLHQKKEAARGKPQGLEAPVVQRVAGGIIEALKLLHDNGTVHRDLKPGNIMIVPRLVKIKKGNEDASATQPKIDYQVKVIDLGIAKEIRGTSHNTTRFSQGTPAYSAPEQLPTYVPKDAKQAADEGSRIKKSTDIYAYGLIVYEMFTGKLPPLKKDGERDFDWTEIPPGWRPIIEKCCSYYPEDRYQDAGELIQNETGILSNAYSIDKYKKQIIEQRNRRLEQAGKFLGSVREAKDKFERGMGHVHKLYKEQLENTYLKAQEQLRQIRQQAGILLSAKKLNERLYSVWKQYYLPELEKIRKDMAREVGGLSEEYAESLENAIALNRKFLDNLAQQQELHEKQVGLDATDMAIGIGTAAAVFSGATAALVAPAPGWLAALFGAGSIAGPVGWSVAVGGALLGSLFTITKRIKDKNKLLEEHLKELQEHHEKALTKQHEWFESQLARISSRVQEEVTRNLKELIGGIELSFRFSREDGKWVVSPAEDFNFQLQGWRLAFRGEPSEGGCFPARFESSSLAEMKLLFRLASGGAA